MTKVKPDNILERRARLSAFLGPCCSHSMFVRDQSMEKYGIPVYHKLRLGFNSDSLIDFEIQSGLLGYFLQLLVPGMVVHIPMRLDYNNISDSTIIYALANNTRPTQKQKASGRKSGLAELVEYFKPR